MNLNPVSDIPLPVLITYLKRFQKRNKLCAFHHHIVEVEAFIFEKGINRQDNQGTGITVKAIKDAVPTLGSAQKEKNLINGEQFGRCLVSIKCLPYFFNPLVPGFPFCYIPEISDIINSGLEGYMYHLFSLSTIAIKTYSWLGLRGEERPS